MARGSIRQLIDLLLRPAKSVEEQPEQALPPGAPRAVTPYHVGIIMDGNGRWATRRGLPRGAGHRAGVEALQRIVEAAPDEQVKMLTVYAFSTENWSRPQDEVNGLMDLFWDAFRRYLDRLEREGVRLRHFGRMDELRPDVRQGILNAVERTQQNDTLHLNVCLNYGGRAEIVAAVRDIMRAGHAPEAVTEELISQHLYSKDVPDPDLIIRTAGEMRSSNFLLWQSAYSEYYATPTLFPDFGRAELARALDAYARRKRKFGGVVAEDPAEPVPDVVAHDIKSTADIIHH